jgi:hypothetical protein
VGVAEDAAVVVGAVVGAGGDEHVPAVPAGVAEDPGVTPGLLVPVAATQPLVPAVVGGDQRGGRLLVPHLQVGRGGRPDGLEDLAVDRGDPGVEQPPAVVAADHAAGPGRHVVERRRLGGGDHVADLDPVAKVLGHGVADRGSVVAPPLVLQGPGGEQEEQVVAVAVVGQPEVPEPGAGEPEHRVSPSLPRRRCCG